MCTQQLVTPGVSVSKKRHLDVAEPYPYHTPKYNKVAPREEEIVLPPKFKTEIESPPKVIEETTEDDDEDFDDLPGLEFLDVTDGFPDDSFSARSPFIPPPFNDAPIKSASDDSDDISGVIDEIEMMNRAPYIPPPCIDKILSFDDLDLPSDMDEGFSLGNQDNQSKMMNTNIDNIPPDFYDIGNARVPYHLVNKYVTKKNLNNQTKVG